MSEEDYRKGIIWIIERIHDSKLLKLIYNFINRYYAEV